MGYRDALRLENRKALMVLMDSFLHSHANKRRGRIQGIQTGSGYISRKLEVMGVHAIKQWRDKYSLHNQYENLTYHCS